VIKAVFSVSHDLSEIISDYYQCWKLLRKNMIYLFIYFFQDSLMN